MAASCQGNAAPPSASSVQLPEAAALGFLRKLNTPCHLLVAYSGGGDSTGLLAALATCRTANNFPITISAATVDHGLRPESTQEALAAGALCARFGIGHVVLRWQGEKPETGLQAAGREARYRLLAAHADVIGADLVVTGHTLDDQIETLAMRRARNPQTSSGISDSVLFDRRIWICRPFLNVRRLDIRNYLAGRGIGWVDDPSNENEKFERVRVRNARDVNGAVADFTALAVARRTLAGETARFLDDHVKIHAACVAELDLRLFDIENPSHFRALLHLAAVIGGRSHTAGRQTAARIADFVHGQARQFAAERVVFDRRKQVLYLVRERRMLPRLVVPAGATAIWDNRFRIANTGQPPVTIVSRADGMAHLLRGSLADLPGAVRQLASRTAPVAEGGDAAGVEITPILANFDQFLPIELFDIANVLAKGLGLEQFPLPPIR